LFDNDINFIFAQTNNRKLLTEFIMETIENNRRSLPEASTVLVLGILSLIFTFSCGIVGLILGIIAVAMASSQRKIYMNAPGEYTESSYNNVNSGRVCGIISICIAAIIIAFAILIVCGVVILGISASTFGW
jgi:hypothetical protein